MLWCLLFNFNQKDFDMCGNCYYREIVSSLVKTLAEENQNLKVGGCAIILEELKKLDIEALHEQENCPPALHSTSLLSTEI